MTDGETGQWQPMPEPPEWMGDCSEEAAGALFLEAVRQGKAGRLLAHLFIGHGARLVGDEIQIIDPDNVVLIATQRPAGGEQ